MRIVVEPNAHHLENVGDVAMLTVALERVASLFPEATLAVITDAPERLASVFPDAVAIPAEGRRLWFQDALVGNRIHRVLPSRLAAGTRASEDLIRRNWPSAARSMIKAKRTIKRRASAPLDAFYEAITTADLLVVSGAGAITDSFAPLASTILDLVALAGRRGIPTAMFGQGIGPIEGTALLAKAAAVLPGVRVIGLREQLRGLPLLREFGVPPERVFVTGDDAIDLAYREGPAPRDRHAIGFSARMARYSGLDQTALGGIATTLREAAERHRAELVGLPISNYSKERDADVIDRALGRGTDTHPPADARDIILRIRDCRLVVTGSYHAAVFALAQGIPVVGLAASEYYVSKFEGLIDQFGTGCSIVHLAAPGAAKSLMEAVDEGWKEEGSRRDALREAAARQVEQSRIAYDSLRDIVKPSALTPAGRRDFNCALQDSPAWDERALAAVRLLRERFPSRGANAEPIVIADFGAGNERLRGVLETALGSPSDYRPFDLRPQKTTTARIDFVREVPAGSFDVVCCLGLLEYLDDVSGFLARVATITDTLVLSYALFDAEERLTAEERCARGWQSHLTQAEVEDRLTAVGLTPVGFVLVNRGRTGVWVAGKQA